MKLPLYNHHGQKVGTTIVPEELTKIQSSPHSLAQAVYVFLNNQRQGTKKAKRRGEVTGSKAKIYSQKGTGRARHGDRFAPLFVGGGVAHGPTGRENYKRVLSKDFTVKTLGMALKDKFEKGASVVIDDVKLLPPKTKNLKRLLKKLEPRLDGVSDPRWGVVIEGGVPAVVMAGRNLPRITIFSATHLTAYDVLSVQSLLLSKTSLSLLKDRIGKANMKKKGGKPS